MSNRYQAGIIRPGYNALKVPDPPTIGTATSASGTSVSVTFTAPSDVGGDAISSYTAFTSCGIYTGSGASSPVTVTGLTTGTPYTFKVIANNVYGPSLPSAVSNSATPAIVYGQQAFTTAGSYSWVAPAGVTKVSVVAVGAGGSTGFSGGAGGGGLGYKNNITVVPGNSYAVVVGALAGINPPNPANGGSSSFINTCTVRGGGGQGPSAGGPCYLGAAGGTYTGDGGGNGGAGGNGGYSGGGAGGAGGYSGNGGAGGNSTYYCCVFVGTGGSAGSGGGGGGGGGAGITGGGVGLLGQGANGASVAYGNTGKGGSGGQDGQSTGGGIYGGGGKQNATTGGGAVRIIWPGDTRSFPSTNTGDV